MRRMELLSRAILLAVLSALLTAALLIRVFGGACGNRAWANRSDDVPLALLLLMGSLLQLAREIRVYMKHMHLE